MWLICDGCKKRYEVDDSQGRTQTPLCAACVAAPQWYYVSNRQKVGPVGMTQLQALLSEGQLKPKDMLLPVGATKWVAAESVEGLIQVKSATDEMWPVSVAPSEQTVGDPGETAAFQTSSESPEPELPTIPGYRIVSVLGRGGMGVVYRAEHLALKRPVALKMILARGYAGEQEQQRFRVEAESVARLRHPNIVQIHEVGEKDGWPFLALEYVEGGSLASQLQGNPWPAERAADLVEQLAKAMQHAH